MIIHIVIMHYIIPNFDYIYYANFNDVLNFFVFTSMVSFIVIEISFEVRGNNKSLDTIFKVHNLRLIIVKKLRIH